MEDEKVCVTGLLPPFPSHRFLFKNERVRGQSVTERSTTYSGGEKLSIGLKGLTSVMSL